MNARDLAAQVKHFVRHWRKARVRHGVHSPFVFALQDGALKESAMRPMPQLEAIRENILADQQLWQRTDLGAGSRLHHSKNLRVGTFAKNSLQSEHACRVLRGLADGIGAQRILELGTALGVTTAYLAADRPQRAIDTVEGDPFLADYAQRIWQQLQLSNIQCHCNSFQDQLETWGSDRRWDLIFVDGDHSYASTMRFWHQLKSQLHGGGCLVFDDIYWSRDMTLAWQEIAQQPEAYLCLDYFKWGVVFLDPRPQKEYYFLKWPTPRPRTKYV
jgi:predicted O-methyltransferase YrrM